jgi:hypothetical protein
MANVIRFWSARTILIAVGALCACSGAFAQQYQADPVDTKASVQGTWAQNLAKNSDQYAAERDRFLEFFSKYYFPAMTRNSPEDLAQLGRMREDLFARYLWASRDENLQRDLTQIAFKAMQPIERNRNYHPAARYNAVLVIGLLDQQYAIEQGADRRPPIPLEDATKELTLVVDYAAQGKPVPPFLLVGALVGLERHAKYHESMDRRLVEGMAEAVIKLLSNDDLLPEVDAKVAEWIRTRAATLLATLGSPGSNGAVQAALAKLIAGQTTPKMSLDGRCQVAASLSSMKYEGATIDGKATADGLVQLATDVADDEAKLAKEFLDSQIAGGGYGGQFGGPRGRRGSRMKFDPETQQSEYDVRILLTRLGDLRSGLVAAKPVVPADKQAVFDAIIGVIDQVIAAAKDDDVVSLEIARSVEGMAPQIRGAVNPGSAPAPANDAGELF